MKAVFDTNILVDYLKENNQAAATLAKYDEKLISRITWIEVFVGAVGSAEETTARALLAGFRVIDVGDQVSERAILLRRDSGMGMGRKLKLPDAIILATAQAENCRLVTRKTKDFDDTSPSILVPYQIPDPPPSSPPAPGNRRIQT